MSYESEATAIFNKNRRETTSLLRFVNDLYNTLLSDIKDELAILRQKNEETDSDIIREKRLVVLQDEIRQQIKALFITQNTTIKKDSIKSERDTYLATALNIEKEVNTGTESPNGFDYSLDYPPFDVPFAESLYNGPVDGMTPAQRSAVDRAVFTGAVVSAVSLGAVIGLNKEELRARLATLSNAFDRAKNKALLKARQLMGNAYSSGDELSVLIAEDRGVKGDHVWNSTLDSRTRPTLGVRPPPNHRTMDGRKRNVKTKLFKFDSGETITAPRIIGKGTAGLRQVMRCRCRRLFAIFGITPNKRGARTAEGNWVEVNGDLTFEEWAKTLEGRRTVAGPSKFEKTVMRLNR